MGTAVLLLVLLPALSLGEGRDLYEHHCIRCHREDSPKPTGFLKAKFRGNPYQMPQRGQPQTHRVPEGKVQGESRGYCGAFSQMEIEIIAEWLAGTE